MSVSDSLVGHLVDGRYHVLRRVARGGMATVYEAVDTRLERRVALKVMHPVLADDQDFVDRFHSEARAAAQLSHPGIVAVFDQGRDGPIVYLAMEYVPGPTLRQLLRERHLLPPEEALSRVAAVLDALSAAHRAGIVHRDVKPENILVGAGGRAKVADFGLARAVDRGSTITRGILLGTVAYISPEQALGQPATPRSDVYSAGIVLFELITGHAPHTGVTDYVVVRKHIEEDVPPPSAWVPGVPAAVDELVRRATTRDPTGRFADAEEFARALTRARGSVNGVPVEWKSWERAGVAAPNALVREHSTAVITADAPAMAAWPPATPTPLEPTTRPPQHPALPPSGEPPKQPRRRRRGAWAFLMILLLAFSVGMGTWLLGAARYTTVPSLLELSAEEAQQKAGNQGISVTVAGERFSETVEEGLVVTTDPEPGDRVLKDGTIGLYVSKGPERYTVPDLVGASVDEARAKLEEVNLAVGSIEERYDDEEDAGVVVKQGTPGDTEVRRDTPVDLVVSKGRQPLTVPSLVGQDADAAEETLDSMGLDAKIDEQPSDSVPANQVIRTEPAAGARLFRGDNVTLVVASGPERVKVPNVEGKRVPEARRILSKAGFRAQVSQLFPGGPNEVVSQTPGKNARVPAGTTIHLLIF